MSAPTGQTGRTGQRELDGQDRQDRTDRRTGQTRHDILFIIRTLTMASRTSLDFLSSSSRTCDSVNHRAGSKRLPRPRFLKYKSKCFLVLCCRSYMAGSSQYNSIRSGEQSLPAAAGLDLSFICILDSGSRILCSMLDNTSSKS